MLIPRVRLFALLALITAVAVVLPAQALAATPEESVAGVGSKWYSGTWLQQAGNNCDIIGGSYSETMVSAIAGYGGAPGGQVPKVGDRYYASVLISIPGNPCGPGSSFVGTDLVLPRGTAVDTSAPIRCFGQPRNASSFGELTGGNWSFTFQNGNTATGKYCPAQVGSSLTGTPGAVGVGFRPLASGQLYELFVPVKSTQNLIGAAANPTDEVRWVLSSSGTYNNTGATSVWANVLPAGSGNQPFIYFARNPSVIPYWDDTKPAPQRNRAEWFANLYSAGLAGTLCWELHDGTTATDPSPLTCTSPGVSGWNGAIPNTSDSWQVFGDGPNGGYVPFAYSIANFTYTIRWRFTPNVGSPVTNDITFTTLAGPDSDGDGVPDSSDACPTVKGPQGVGCQPAVQSDPDGDGVFGSADKCPAQSGAGAPDGCPPPAPAGPGTPPGGLPPGTPVTPDVPSALVLTGSLGTIKGNAIKRAALAKGAPIPISCGLDSDAAATLTLKSAVAKKLKIPVKKKQTDVTIGSAKGKCTAAAGGTLKLTLTRSLAAKVRKPKKGFAANLTVVFTRAGSTPVKVPRALKLT